MDPSRRFVVSHYVQPCATCKEPCSVPVHLADFADWAVVCSDACSESYPGALVVLVASRYKGAYPPA